MSPLLATAGSPHWLLVSFDQWRGDWLSQPELQLPTLKRLAQTALVPGRCLTASPQCVPARASWLTGLWPSQLGVTRNQPYALPADSPSFVRHLAQAGWHTALIGKTHWHPHAAGLDLRDRTSLLAALGFAESLEIAGPRALMEVTCALTDAWQAHNPMLLEQYRSDLRDRYLAGPPWRVRPSILPSPLYPDIWVADQACAWLQQRGPSPEPWMLWVSFPGPHEPWDTPAPWAGLHGQRRLPAATARPAWMLSQPLASECRQRLEQWTPGPGREAIRALRADYADHLALLDHQLARLLAHLPEPERTTITVVSDHGELLGDAGLLYKSCFLEGAVRSLALHRPCRGLPPWGRRPQQPIGLSWLLAAAAEEVATGRPLATQRHPPYAFSEFGTELMISDRRRKLVLDGGGNPLWAIDLIRDPEEQHNRLSPGQPLSGPWQRLRQVALAHQNHRLGSPLTSPVS